MLHELLFALQGYTGSIFIEKDSKIIVVPNISFLQPPEESLLNKLCALGSHYKYLSDFTDKHLKTSGLSELYLQALSTGLDEVLLMYREDLTKLEQDIIKDQHLSLTYISQNLDKYFLLLPNLRQLISQIEEQEIHGCRILEAVYNHSFSGISYVKEAITILFQKCNVVFFRQLIGWTLYGILTDPWKEFFIQPKEESSVLGEDESIITVKPQSYRLEPSLIPSYLSGSTAERILFIGQTMLTNSKQFPMESIFKSKQEEFTKKFYSMLNKNEFIIFEFEATITSLRNLASEHLWRVIVKDANLLGQLKTLKDFFLLGHGDLFLLFLDNANQMLRLPLTERLEQDIAMAFQVASRRVFWEDDSVPDKFSLSFNHTEKTKLPVGWSHIGLRYEASSPLDMLFTPAVLSRFNTIFLYLLSIQHVHRELNLVWRTQHKAGKFCLLRHQMIFIINSLQRYLHTDVLESNFSILQNKINTVLDFEAIQDALEQFLTDVITQSFMILKPVYSCLQKILRLCLDYCAMVTLNTLSPPMIENKIKEFNQNTEVLLQTLNSMHRHHPMPHIEQLLFRINFNKFYINS